MKKWWCIFPILYITASHSYFYQYIVLKNPKKRQLIIVFSDWHDFPSKISEQQQTWIKRYLKKRSKKAHVIIEDIGSNHNGSSESRCKNIQIKCKDGILAQFAQWCYTNTIACSNVEFRYCRVGASMPVLHNHLLSFSTQQSYDQITLQDIIEESTCMQKIYGQPNQPMSMQHLFEDESPKNFQKISLRTFLDKQYVSKNHKEAFVKKILLHDADIIEKKIIETINNSQPYPLLIIITGGSHANKINTILQKNQYYIQYQNNGNRVPPIKSSTPHHLPIQELLWLDNNT